MSANHELHEDGVPEDLGPRALKKLGRFRKPVQQFVQRVNKIRWMEHGGKPEPWDGTVVRTRDIEESKRIDAAHVSVSDAVWNSLESIGRAVGRYDAMEAAEEYWIAYFDPYPRAKHGYVDSLAAQIHADLVGALREIILDDVVPIHFFREAVDWYERGHWRCGISKDGRRIVW